MTQEPEKKRQVPEIEVAFAELLKKFRVGIKEDMAETMTENIARTGGEYVFEDPQQLAERLATWHEYITPVKRKQVLEQWFAEKGVVVPQEALELAGIKGQDYEKKAETEKKKVEEEEKKKAKFFVDEDTGRIRAARGDEVALTWEQALTVSERIKKEVKVKPEPKREPAFMISPDGEWTINPKADLSFSDFLTWDMYKKAQERGEPADPFEIMKQRATDFEFMRNVFGGGKEGSSLTDMVEAFSKFRELSNTDKDLKATLDKITEILAGEGVKKGETEDSKLLREEVATLRKELRQKELDTLKDQISGLHTTIQALSGEVQKARQQQSATNEFGIMSKIVDVFDRRLGSIENTVTGLIRRPPRPLTEAEQTAIKEGITEVVQEETEVANLGKELWRS